VAKFLLGAGIKEIRAYDPVAGNNFLKYFSGSAVAEKIKLADNEARALSGAEVLIIAGDWPQFRELEALIKQNLPREAIIMDGRRMLQQKYGELSQAGYSIIAVGSPTIRAGKQ
jgi:UDPglucose 6-dehydrogenase